MFKKKSKVPPAPRQTDDIAKEYQEVAAKFASTSYQAHVYGKEAKRLLEIMEQLNLEGSARRELDAAVAAEKEA